MKLRAELGGEVHDVSLQRDGSNLLARVSDREYNLNIQAEQTREYLLREGTRLHNCRVEETETKSIYLVQVGGNSYRIRIADPKRLSAGHSAGAHHHGSAEIAASMPGKVVRVLVEVGTQVEAGAGIVVVEAMKMQNEMKAPKAGKVTGVHVTAGATVNAGDVLAVIE